MVKPGRSATDASVAAASVCAFAMIATQVAGKATRDALFLTHFDISALPLALMASAGLSIGAVLLTARVMAARGPVHVIPPLFVASGLLLVAEWLLAIRSERLTSALVYLRRGDQLHSDLGLLNDHRDPDRTAKRVSVESCRR
jgi:hypothetical protein